MRASRRLEPIIAAIGGEGRFEGFVPVDRDRFAGVLFDKETALEVASFVNETNERACMRYDGERDSFVEDVDGFEIAYPSDADGLYAIGPDGSGTRRPADPTALPNPGSETRELSEAPWHERPGSLS